MFAPSRSMALWVLLGAVSLSPFAVGAFDAKPYAALGVMLFVLAAVSGRADWREWRRIRFVTDEYGFRNESPSPGSEARPLDLIVLVDSFGVAAGTSQEEILSS